MATSDEQRPEPHELGALPEERPSGEDHRDGPPGYDLDEQAVYAERLRQREQGSDRPAEQPEDDS
jgi:hypothetical protein